MMKLKLLKDKRAYSLTFWTVFFGFILIPILALNIERRRYFCTRAEIANAASLPALPRLPPPPPRPSVPLSQESCFPLP